MSDLEDTAITSRSPIPTSNNPFTPEATPGPSVPPNAAALLKQQKSKKDDMPPVVKLANSKGSDHLDKAFKKNNDNNMSFQSYAAVGIAIGPSRWHPPLQDATIPQTDEQDRGVVRRLFDAMRDIDSALDTENSPYRKRFTPGKDTCYEPWTVEACAWEILALIKTIHINGFNAAIFDTHILADIGQTENWTFEQRVDMVCRVVRNSKNVAVTLMKREKVWTILGAPHKLYHSNLINTVSNKDRNLDVKNGRAARKGAATKTLKRKASTEEVAKKKKAAKMAKTADTVSETSASPAPVPDIVDPPFITPKARSRPAANEETQNAANAAVSKIESGRTTPTDLQGPSTAAVSEIESGPIAAASKIESGPATPATPTDPQGAFNATVSKTKSCPISPTPSSTAGVPSVETVLAVLTKTQDHAPAALTVKSPHVVASIKTHDTPAVLAKQPDVPVASIEGPTLPADGSNVQATPIPQTASKVRSGEEIKHAELLMGLLGR